MRRAKILLVDNDGRTGLQEVLDGYDFDVVPATGVTEALNAIGSQRFDILITDLHIPNPDDSFAVMTAMRHFQPWAMRVALSAVSGMRESSARALQQADKVLEKPIAVKQLVGLIRTGMRERTCQ